MRSALPVTTNEWRKRPAGESIQYHIIHRAADRTLEGVGADDLGDVEQPATAHRPLVRSWPDLERTRGRALKEASVQRALSANPRAVVRAIAAPLARVQRPVFAGGAVAPSFLVLRQSARWPRVTPRFAMHFVDSMERVKRGMASPCSRWWQGAMGLGPRFNALMARRRHLHPAAFGPRGMRSAASRIAAAGLS